LQKIASLITADCVLLQISQNHDSALNKTQKKIHSTTLDHVGLSLVTAKLSMTCFSSTCFHHLSSFIVEHELVLVLFEELTRALLIEE